MKGVFIMRYNLKLSAGMLLSAGLALYGPLSWSLVDPEDQKLIDAAGCDEIVKEYKNYSAAEKQVIEEIRKAGNSTVATNALGVATMATLGIGFFTWNNSADAESNLAEIRAYRMAIEAAGKKKSCNL